MCLGSRLLLNLQATSPLQLQTYTHISAHALLGLQLAPTVKALWTSLGWRRAGKSFLTVLRLSSVWSGLDESPSCRGPKPRGGFTRATDERSAAVSQSGQRDWNSSNGFHGIKKTTLPGLERGCWRHRFEGRKERMSCETVRPQPPALSFCLGIKNKTTYLDEDSVSVQSVMRKQANTAVIKQCRANIYYRVHWLILSVFSSDIWPRHIYLT